MTQTCESAPSAVKSTVVLKCHFCPLSRIKAYPKGLVAYECTAGVPTLWGEDKRTTRQWFERQCPDPAAAIDELVMLGAWVESSARVAKMMLEVQP